MQFELHSKSVETTRPCTHKNMKKLYEQELQRSTKQKNQKKQTTATDNDSVFLEASKPAKLRKNGDFLCFENAAQGPVTHTVFHKDSIYS